MVGNECQYRCTEAGVTIAVVLPAAMSVVRINESMVAHVDQHVLTLSPTRPLYSRSANSSASSLSPRLAPV